MSFIFLRLTPTGSLHEFWRRCAAYRMGYNVDNPFQNNLAKLDKKLKSVRKNCFLLFYQNETKLVKEKLHQCFGSGFTGPESDPDPAFRWPTIKDFKVKNPPWRVFKIQEKPPPQYRTSNTSNINFLQFCPFCGSFLPSWIRNQFGSWSEELSYTAYFSYPAFFVHGKDDVSVGLFLFWLLHGRQSLYRSITRKY